MERLRKFFGWTMVSGGVSLIVITLIAMVIIAAITVLIVGALLFGLSSM